LLLGPWLPDASADAPASMARIIWALPEMEVVGQALRLLPARWSWLTGPTLVVREGEDASLLMSMRRAWPWSRCWTVRDADDRLVGRVKPQVVFNARGQMVARQDMPRPTAPRRLVGADDRELADLQFRPDGALAVSFAPTQDRNPFTRMLLLGAALVVP
jgi:hypothetical protein